MDTLKDKVCGWLVSGSNTPGVMCCTAGAAKSAAAHIGGDASVEPLIRLSEAQAAIAELTRERDELAQQRGDLLQRVVELEGEHKRLQAEAAKSERRAITFGDIVHQQVLAMRAAVVAGHLESPEAGMRWIENTLCGPGHLPDVDEAMELGGAQALFDKEVAEHEAFRADHPAPRLKDKHDNNC